MEEKVIHTLLDGSAPPETVLERLDTIIRELQNLRRVLIAKPPDSPTTKTPLTQHLSGILIPPGKHEDRDILEEYRALSDWERFS